MSIRILHLWLIAGAAVALETLTRLVSGVASPQWVMTGLVAVLWFCVLVTAWTWMRGRS